ncbi:ribosomal-protein-alanine N-acetyltransferase [Pedobacter sp. CG_S7]|uniref:GNAT family N-acetyltransferase n=1 Tax=Pedobacter sp. CG_S7 TaxID=3143930 RepID=UPI003396C8AD
MKNIKIYNNLNPPTDLEQNQIVLFLLTQLEEYGDPQHDIEKAIAYALKDNPGGLVIAAMDGSILTGAVVLNRTGMDSYIPENILVYIATHKNYRGQGIGKDLMRTAIDQSQGNIALHVEPNNPAKNLYEKLGFTNKYLEMRLIKKN